MHEQGLSRLSWCAAVAAVGLLALGQASGAPFVRGDIDQNRSVDISDSINVLLYLFVPEHDSVPCEDAADVDDSGGIGIGDAIYGLTYLFAGGRGPRRPSRAAGTIRPRMPFPAPPSTRVLTGTSPGRRRIETWSPT